jgi:hypothetical protein
MRGEPSSRLYMLLGLWADEELRKRRSPMPTSSFQSLSMGRACSRLSRSTAGFELQRANLHHFLRVRKCELLAIA